VESKGVGKEGFVASMQIASRDGRGIEWKAHVREAGPDELSINSRVVGKGRAEESFVSIELVCENMLELKVFDCSSKVPKRRGIFEPVVQSSDRVANITCNRVRKCEVQACHQQKGTGSSFNP
jgi:hypothetical protein